MKKILTIILIIAALFSSQESFSQQKAMLNHIAVYVTNLKTSTAFYQDVIGLDTIPEPFHDGKHTWFGVGVKSHLHLIEGLKQKNIIEKNNHLCFSVASVPEFIKVLEKKNIEFENWAGTKNTFNTRVDGVKQIYFKDPDGYWIEINDAKE